MTSHKKLTKRIFAILMAIALMIPSASLSVFADDEGPTTGNVWNHATQVGENSFVESVSKTATETEEEGVFDIELKVAGDSITDTIYKKLDIVFVLDNSGSMKSASVNAANNAINNFMGKLVPEGESNNNIRFGLLIYAENIKKTISLTDDKSAISNALPSGDGNGGTFTQAGLRAGQALFQNSGENTRKIIVLLTDGVPTYSYKVKEVGGISDDSDNIKLYGNSYNGEYEAYRGVDFTTTVVGTGNSYVLSNADKHKLWLNQTDKNAHIEEGYLNWFTWVPRNHTQKLTVVDNGFATISEARNIRDNSNIEIFGVALNMTGSGNGISPANAENVIKDIASDDKFFEVTNANISDALGNIAESLTVNSIKNGTLTDPMSEYVELVGTVDQNNITLEGFGSENPEKPTVSLNGGTITVTGINLGAEQFMTLEYQVKMNESEYGKGWKDLNGETFLTEGNEKLDINVPQGRVNTPDPDPDPDPGTGGDPTPDPQPAGDGEIVIYKESSVKNEEGFGERLNDAVFELYLPELDEDGNLAKDEDGNYVTVGSRLLDGATAQIGNEEGKLVFKLSELTEDQWADILDIFPDDKVTFLLKETKAPDGYNIDSEITPVVMTKTPNCVPESVALLAENLEEIEDLDTPLSGGVAETPEVTPEVIPEGTPEGTPDGVPEGTPDGVPEGTPDGVPEGNNTENEGVQEPTVSEDVQFSHSDAVPEATATLAEAVRLSVGDDTCTNFKLTQDGGFITIENAPIDNGDGEEPGGGEEPGDDTPLDPDDDDDDEEVPPTPTPIQPGGGGGGGQSTVRPDAPTPTPTVIDDEPTPLAEPEIEELEIAEEAIPLTAPEEVEIADEIVPLAEVPKTGIGCLDFSSILSANYVVSIDAVLEDKRKRK